MATLDPLLARLRSRRLTIVLLGIISVLCFIGTLVPQVSRAGGAAVGSWQSANPWLAPVTRLLGLHVVFSSPIFLATLAVLAASTAVCAWDRTTIARNRLRAAGRISEREASRLEEHPSLVVPLAAGIGGDDPLKDVGAALHSLGLRVIRGPRALDASSSRLGILGSPLFHWSLVALILVTAFGRLSRSEGFIGVPVGYSRYDTAESYRKDSPGPLYPGHSGLILTVSDLRPYTDPEGVPRGIAPRVKLASARSLLREQWVYPNNPMRYGSLLIHQADYGLAAVFSVDSTTGANVLQFEQLVDFDDSKPTGTTAAEFELTDPHGGTLETLTVSVPLDREDGKPVRVRPKRLVALVSVTRSGVHSSTVLPKGAAWPLPTGHILRLVDIVYYARLSVADDWSIYPIYSLFVIAALALTVAILAPYRRVLVLLRVHADGRELAVSIRHSRNDPLFAERVEEALREAASAPPIAEEESA